MPIIAIENQKLTAADAAMEDYFGWSVAISGDYIIIGARGDDDKGVNSGAAYIFKNDGSDNFTQMDKLTALDGSAGDVFGWSVAISGNYAIVGAPGVNNSDGVNTGAAYIFENNHNGTFTQKATLTGDGSLDWFGKSVAISGDYAIVNAPENRSAYIFKNDGNGNFSKIAILSIPNVQLGYKVAISDEYVAVTTKSAIGDIPGSAYLFKNVADSFNQIAKLDGSTSGYDAYGSDIKINGQYIIVGAMGDDSAYGSAYLYKNDEANNFPSMGILAPSDKTSGDRFGCSVDIHGSYIAIGAFGHPFDLSTGLTQNKGAAFIFKIDGSGNFNEIAKLATSDGAKGDHLGYSVAINGHYAIAGAARNSTKEDYPGSLYIDEAGAAYIYDLPCQDENISITPPTGLTRTRKRVKR